MVYLPQASAFPLERCFLGLKFTGSEKSKPLYTLKVLCTFKNNCPLWKIKKRGFQELDGFGIIAKRWQQIYAK